MQFSLFPTVKSRCDQLSDASIEEFLNANSPVCKSMSVSENAIQYRHILKTQGKVEAQKFKSDNMAATCFGMVWDVGARRLDVNGVLTNLIVIDIDNIKGKTKECKEFACSIGCIATALSVSWEGCFAIFEYEGYRPDACEQLIVLFQEAGFNVDLKCSRQASNMRILTDDPSPIHQKGIVYVGKEPEKVEIIDDFVFEDDLELAEENVIKFKDNEHIYKMWAKLRALYNIAWPTILANSNGSTSSPITSFVLLCLAYRIYADIILSLYVKGSKDWIVAMQTIRRVQTGELKITKWHDAYLFEDEITSVVLEALRKYAFQVGVFAKQAKKCSTFSALFTFVEDYCKERGHLPCNRKALRKYLAEYVYTTGKEKGVRHNIKTQFIFDMLHKFGKAKKKAKQFNLFMQKPLSVLFVPVKRIVEWPHKKLVRKSKVKKLKKLKLRPVKTPIELELQRVKSALFRCHYRYKKLGKAYGWSGIRWDELAHQHIRDMNEFNRQIVKLEEQVLYGTKQETEKTTG